MEIVMPYLAILFIFGTMFMANHNSETKPTKAEYGISDQKSVYVSQVITASENKKQLEPLFPDYIKKNRTSDAKAAWEWKKEWQALLQASCTQHFGLNFCNNCETYDHSTPHGCSCDSITQKNMTGEICLTFRQEDPSCHYHSKEHSFV